jgi:hypothetical protein
MKILLLEDNSILSDILFHHLKNSLHEPVLLYLHGFNSSPGSAKAQQMAAWVAENRPDIEVVIPAQPNTPAAAWAAIEQAIADLKAEPGDELKPCR